MEPHGEEDAGLWTHLQQILQVAEERKLSLMKQHHDKFRIRHLTLERLGGAVVSPPPEVFFEVHAKRLVVAG